MNLEERAHACERIYRVFEDNRGDYFDQGETIHEAERILKAAERTNGKVKYHHAVRLTEEVSDLIGGEGKSSMTTKFVTDSIWKVQNRGFTLFVYTALYKEAKQLVTL